MADHEIPVLPSATADALRREESDRFLSALFAPADQRAAVMALYALDRELKRIPHLVSEPMLGAIRFQWWRDTIGALYQGEHPAHEIVPALGQAIAQGNLPPEAFHAWIDARENEMEEYPFADMHALTAHARAGDGTVMALAVQVLGADDANAEALGTAYGVMDLLRRCGAAASRRTAFLPAELLGEHDADLFAGNFTPALQSVYTAICDHAHAAYIEASGQGGQSKEAMPALLPAGLVPAYMRLMRRRGFDPLRSRVEIPAFRRQMALMARVMRGRV